MYWKISMQKATVNVYPRSKLGKCNFKSCPQTATMAAFMHTIKKPHLNSICSCCVTVAPMPTQPTGRHPTATDKLTLKHTLGSLAAEESQGGGEGVEDSIKDQRSTSKDSDESTRESWPGRWQWSQLIKMQEQRWAVKPMSCHISWWAGTAGTHFHRDVYSYKLLCAAARGARDGIRM